ncbi:MAG: hypothetical protein CFE38_20450 [Comamonadaceae bacterium PBBC1]|nr:MAG: hypothetical protein CFE38_20450 [Comamonadaceae bacterium PBBC1]
MLITAKSTRRRKAKYPAKANARLRAAVPWLRAYTVSLAPVFQFALDAEFRQSQLNYQPITSNGF